MGLTIMEKRLGGIGMRCEVCGGRLDAIPWVPSIHSSGGGSMFVRIWMKVWKMLRIFNGMVTSTIYPMVRK